MALLMAQGAAPNTPAAGKSELFVDSADGKTKVISPLGEVSILDNDGWRDRNLLANGDHAVLQRVAAALTTVPGAQPFASRVNVADRWAISNQTASVQFQQVDAAGAPEAGLTARYYGKLKQITGAGKVVLSQAIAAGETIHLRGKLVRLQALLRYSYALGMTVRLGLLQLTSGGTADSIPGARGSGTFVSAWGASGVDPTWGANLALVAPTSAEPSGFVSGSAVTGVLGSAAWARYSATFLVPSDCKNLVVAVWSNSQFAVGDELNVTECGLYLGQEYRVWVPLPEALELARCLRYFAKTFPAATAPAQNAGANGALRGIVGKAGATALAAQLHWRYPVPLQASPAVVTYNPGAANAQARRTSGTPADLSATAAANTCDVSTDVTATGDGSGAVGDLVAVHATADAEI